MRLPKVDKTKIEGYMSRYRIVAVTEMGLTKYYPQVKWFIFWNPVNRCLFYETFGMALSQIEEYRSRFSDKKTTKTTYL